VIEEPYDFPSRVQEIIDARKAENEKKLADMIDDLHTVDEFRVIKMKGIVEAGKVLSVTQRIAADFKHDLIVIGLGGEADLKKVLYGSITNNLLMTSEIPVLAISKQIDFRSPKRLLFATDMRKKDIRQIKTMREFCFDVGMKLDFIHIAESIDEIDLEALQSFNKKIATITMDPEKELTIHEAPDFSEGITDYIGHDKETLLVMIRYRKKFLEWLLSNSTVRSVAQMASVPLLMIPAD